MAITQAELQRSIADGAVFLLAAQDDDGLWRDYRLEPGASETWVTAVVGLTLARCEAFVAPGNALDRAVDAVHRHRKPDGWGYNARTAADADTTAWALRFLAGQGALRGLDAAGLLGPFITPTGGVRTFKDPERFGNWAAIHPDVTPLVGMALVESKADVELIRFVRRGCLNGRDDSGLWLPYWWSSKAYGIAHNLQFLTVSGGIPVACKEAAKRWMYSAPAPETPFDAAQRVVIACLLDLDPGPWLRPLLQMQLAHGGWPFSPELLVPSQWEGTDAGRSPVPQPDPKGLMTTSMALLALLTNVPMSDPR